MDPARFITISRRLGGLLLVTLGVLVLGGAGAAEETIPEIVRASIPARRVADFFPAGDQLRLMAPHEFDALVNAAEERSRRIDSAQPRLIRARHSARFGDGVLTGKSELVVSNASRRPATLPLEPWSPAILAGPKTGAAVGSLVSGMTALWVDPPTDASDESTITLEWELRARPNSRGHLFALALPGDETSSLTLDAPKGSAPSGVTGHREGPVAGAGPERELWRFHGRVSACELRLVDLEAKKGESNQPRVWVGGPTRIDLGATAGEEAQTVNFTTEWTVQTAPGESDSLSAELGAGLELLGVVGPAVREFHLDPRTEEGTTRVTVTLAPSPDAASKVQFQAHVRAPLEGTWTIPSIRPLAPAVWIGGATSVALDAYHKVRACRERDGRRIPPSSTDPNSTTQIVFESTAPGPVADLTFRAAPPPSPYVVRGRLLARESSTRLECDFEGLGLGGAASEYEVELPPSWVLDRVQVSGIDDAVSWRQTVRSDGRTLLRVLAPSTDPSAEGRTLSLSAGTSAAPGRGPLALPQVRLTSGTIADETWVALVDEATTLTPISTSGLAWIDPAQVKGLLPSTSSSSDLRPALAWRWTAESASAMVDRQRAAEERQGWIHLKARIEDQGRRLALSGRITVTGGCDEPESLPIWIDQSPLAVATWTFVDPATGRKLATSPVSDSSRRKYGFPRSGVVLEIATDRPNAGRTTVDFRAEAPWSGQGRIPLPCLPGEFVPRCAVVIETPHRMRSDVVAEGLSRIAPSLAGRLVPPPESSKSTTSAKPSTASNPYWTAHALAYWKPGSKLELTTEALTPAAITGVIHDARLTTLVYPEGRWLNRLQMVVGAEPTAAIPLKLPYDAVLARVRVDGLDVAPALDQGRLSIPPSRGLDATSRTIEMDYHVNVDKSFDRRAPRPIVPDLGLPCLSFGWELILPTDWELEQASPGFVVNSMDAATVWPFGTLGFPRPRWPGSRTSPRLAEPALRALDEQISNAASGELTFSEWFIRWDSGTNPVVIDRLALSGEGYGPESLCQPAPRDASGSGTSIALRTLRRNGLAMVLVDDAIVITSQRKADRDEAAANWRDAIVEALFWGSDRTDRFQSTARWRGEAVSGDSNAADAAGGARPLPGWSTWRLSSAGWPGPGSQVQTLDRTSRIIPGWLIAVLIVVFGFRGGRTLRRGLIWPLLLMTAAVVVYDRVRIAPPLTAGLFLGALGLLLVRLGRLLRKTLGEVITGLRANRGRAPLLSRPGTRIATLLGASAACLAIPSAWAALDAQEPIVALLPYDGGYNPKVPPARVVIREDDYQRLARIARPPAAAKGLDLAILAADHHVKRSKNREINVVSDYTLKLEQGFVAFDFPVSGARDIKAVVDDQAVPVVIAPDGARGVVTLDGGRTVKLQLRRVAVSTVDGALEVLNLKINPNPLARLTLDQPAGFLPIQYLNARGKQTPEGERTIHANLGPVDHIEIVWKSEQSGLEQPGASVESIILWDLDPAGERIRARLTYRPRRRTSRIEIAMEPGLIPRAIEVPGLVDSTWGGTPQNPKWIATIDPPLQDGTTVSLDLWRPLPPGESVDASGTTTRRFPTIEPLGVDREVGLLAARRPSHWTGRLEPIPGAEPLSDESFVRAWKTLPDDALTFAGTVRLNARDAVEFRTGPTPLRLKLRPSVRLQIESGRLDCQIEAELTDISGLLDRLEFQLPEPLIVLGVESEGMTDWSRPVGGPLQVRFDRVESTSRRLVKIKGWIPFAELDAKARPRQIQTPLPWVALALPGVSTAPGLLTVASRTPVELSSTTDGATLLSSGTADVGGPGARQVVYRIDDPTKAGDLRWTPAPARVNVRVLSQMTIHPDSAEWFAILRYDVAGGSLDAIHLKVPTAWAGEARLQLSGQDPLTSESRDESTFWTITPERPIWGSQRLVLRSSVPIASEQEVAFPEIAPLGQGVVDAWLGLVSATVSPPTPTWLPGLRPITYASRFQADEFGDASGITTRAYHVERENWSLKVQAPRHADASRPSNDTARVKSAEVTCVLSADGALLGRVSYQTEPRTGPFLKVELPPKGVLTWATVAGTAVAPLLGEGGEWMIPLGEQASQCVTVIWTETPIAVAPSGSRFLTLPRAGLGKASTVVSVHLPPDRTLKPVNGGLELVGSEHIDQVRSDRIAQRITEFLAEIDRGSGRDRERLTSLLISHELALRTVEHALVAVSKRGADRARRDRATREIEVVKASRAAVLEAVRSVGLEEQIEAARVYLGLSVETAEAQTRGVPEPTGVDRIRKLGKPTYLDGSAAGLQDLPVQIEVVADSRSWYAGSTADRARSILLLVLLLGLATIGLTAARLASAQALMIAASLTLAGLAGGPPGLILAVAVVVIGWSSGSPRRTREPARSVRTSVGSTVVRAAR